MGILVAALHKVLAKHDVENDMGLLMTIGSDDRTEKFYLSKEGDEEWEFQVEENDYEDTREEFAKDQAEFWRDAGYPNANYYDPPKKISPQTWLAHFTDADPQKVIKEGFHGKDYEVLGLTSSGALKAEPGPYAFAYKADNVKSSGFNSEFGKYGKNLILFKAKHAVSTYHYGDEEEQVIFLNYSAYDLHPIYGDEDTMVFKKGRKKFSCDRDQNCVDTLIDMIEGK